ncbi:MAG: methionine--tRNA ligase, partial [Bacteroidales bacterium]|nr:methionine--tRNA ligase [Bacteroidales bacterium]
SLNATDLINPKSTFSGNAPVLKDTKHWFLPLDQYEPWLREWILEGHKNDWKSNVYGQCKSWIDQGLHPRAVTRDLDWGVKVPVADAEGKVLYVWFDAPIGYISATKEWAQKNNQNWETWWKDQESKLVHFIGKDNIVFHCIIFPIMLHAEGSYILPDNVPANEFLNLEGDKISTSKNWAVWLHEYLEDFADKQDVLRYSLCANAPEAKDNDFTWKDFQAKNNNELLAIFGNFVNRTIVLTHKYFDGIVPAKNQWLDIDTEVLEAMSKFPEKIGRNIELYKFREASFELMNLARLGNKYLTETEPWKVFKTNPERVASILHVALQICANLAVLSEPFLPFTSKKLSKLLNLSPKKWIEAGVDNLLAEGGKIEAAAFLFEKIEDETIQKQIDKLHQTKNQNQLDQSAAEPQKENVTFDDFSAMDLRVATILEAEKVPKTKKLLKLLVDTGIDKRTIVSGIAEFYEPQNIIGEQVCMIVNLAPREIKGILSQGMILMAENANGELCFVKPSKQVNSGSGIK